MNRYKTYTLFALFSLLSCIAEAAKPQVSARIEPAEGMIGDRFTITVTVEKDVMQVINFPVFEGNKITNEIELLAEAQPDTLSVEGRNIVLRKRYLVTSFDAGRYSLNGFAVLYVDKNIVDTLRTTNSLQFEVRTFEIDTATQTIYDIKAVENTPLVVGEFEWYAFGLLLLGLIIAAAVIMTARYVARRRGYVTAPQKPKEPAHVTAIRALEALHGQKLWQAGKVKNYYTALTDILRRYLSERYGIDAMESTTDEILTDLQSSKNNEIATIQQTDRVYLTSILRQADIVKFAKGQPTAEDNEILWQQACDFVQNTKDVVTETENSK